MLIKVELFKRSTSIRVRKARCGCVNARYKGEEEVESLKQEQHEKHVLYLPRREQYERFPELQIDANDIRLIDARVFSTAIATTNAYQWREFLRLQLPSEKISRVYNLGTGPNTEVMFAKPQDKEPWMLYRTYNRVDELTTLDYKEMKLFYLQYMPQPLLNNDDELSLHYITDWLSIAYVMRNELERRRVGTNTYGHGARVTASNLCITPLCDTHRKSFAKEQMKNFKIWPQMIADSAQDVLKSLKHRTLFVENVIRFGGMSKIVKEFIKENREWVDERLNVTNIGKQIVLGKNRIEELNRILPFNSAYHLTCELHEMPPPLGHAVFFCRALKNLSLSMGRAEIVRKTSKSNSIPLRIYPTRYEYKPNAMTTYKESTDFIEPLALGLHEAPRRAPSLNSLSGFSSESGASTATESPGDWQHNWKMQTMHRDMEHRLMDSSIQNPLEERQIGELEASQRIADEIDRRMALLNDRQQFQGPFGAKSEHLRYYQELLFERKIRIQRDKRQANTLVAKINQMLDSATTIESGGRTMDLKLNDYVFNELLRMTPECDRDPYDGLGINGAWKTIIDSGLLKFQSRGHLKTVLSSHHSWVSHNFLAQHCMVPRCDQLQQEVMTMEEVRIFT
ncbi:hypothetical protein Q1695_001746 [Nippostrongylus brasiliensis]|nr:hypothetical protein Q1695_001746 [Nippostrongylus brasiliensis]